MQQSSAIEAQDAFYGEGKGPPILPHGEDPDAERCRNRARRKRKECRDDPKNHLNNDDKKTNKSGNLPKYSFATPPMSAETERSLPDMFPASELPAGFPPDLVFRALAAYSTIRTLSISLRLSPFTPNVFLRALYLPFPNRLMGHIHVALLRILLPSLHMGYHWNKGTSGQKQNPSLPLRVTKKRKIDGVRWPLRAGDDLEFLDHYTWPLFFDDYSHLVADIHYASWNDLQDYADLKNLDVSGVQSDLLKGEIQNSGNVLSRVGASFRNNRGQRHHAAAGPSIIYLNHEESSEEEEAEDEFEPPPADDGTSTDSDHDERDCKSKKKTGKPRGRARKKSRGSMLLDSAINIPPPPNKSVKQTQASSLKSNQTARTNPASVVDPINTNVLVVTTKSSSKKRRQSSQEEGSCLAAFISPGRKVTKPSPFLPFSKQISSEGTYAPLLQHNQQHQPGLSPSYFQGFCAPFHEHSAAGMHAAAQTRPDVAGTSFPAATSADATDRQSQVQAVSEMLDFGFLPLGPQTRQTIATVRQGLHFAYDGKPCKRDEAATITSDVGDNTATIREREYGKNVDDIASESKTTAAPSKLDANPTEKVSLSKSPPSFVSGDSELQLTPNNENGKGPFYAACNYPQEPVSSGNDMAIPAPSESGKKEGTERVCISEDPVDLVQTFLYAKGSKVSDKTKVKEESETFSVGEDDTKPGRSVATEKPRSKMISALDFSSASLDDPVTAARWPHFSALERMRGGTPYHRLSVEQKLDLLEFLIDDLLSLDIFINEMDRRHELNGLNSNPYGRLPCASELAELENEDYCAVCGKDGDLLCCDGCVCSIHRECISMSKKETLPEGNWYCPECSIVDPAKYGPLNGGRKSRLEWFSIKQGDQTPKLTDESGSLVTARQENSVRSFEYIVVHGFVIRREVKPSVDVLASSAPTCLGMKDLYTFMTVLGPRTSSCWPLIQIPCNTNAIWQQAGVNRGKGYLASSDSYDPSAYKNAYRVAPLFVMLRRVKDAFSSNFEQQCYSVNFSSLSSRLSNVMERDKIIVSSLRIDVRGDFGLQMVRGFMVSLERNIIKACLVEQSWGLPANGKSWATKVNECKSVAGLSRLLVALVDAIHPRAFDEAWYHCPSAKSHSKDPDDDVVLRMATDLKAKALVEKWNWERCVPGQVPGLLARYGKRLSDWVRELRPDLSVKQRYRKRKYKEENGSPHKSSTNRDPIAPAQAANMEFEILPVVEMESSKKSCDEVGQDRSLPTLPPGIIARAILGNEKQNPPPEPKSENCGCIEKQENGGDDPKNTAFQVHTTDDEKRQTGPDAIVKNGPQGNPETEKLLQEKGFSVWGKAAQVSESAEDAPPNDRTQAKIPRAITDRSKARRRSTRIEHEESSNTTLVVDAQDVGKLTKKSMESILVLVGNNVNDEFSPEQFWPVAGRGFFDPVGRLPYNVTRRLARRGGCVYAPFVVYSPLFEVGQMSNFHVWRKRVLSCWELEELLVLIRMLASFVDSLTLHRASALVKSQGKSATLSSRILCSHCDARNGEEYFLVLNKAMRAKWISFRDVDLDVLIAHRFEIRQKTIDEHNKLVAERQKAIEEERKRVEALAKARAIEEERKRVEALAKARAIEEERKRAEALAKARAIDEKRKRAEALAKPKAQRNSVTCSFSSQTGKSVSLREAGLLNATDPTPDSLALPRGAIYDSRGRQLTPKKQNPTPEKHVDSKARPVKGTKDDVQGAKKKIQEEAVKQYQDILTNHKLAFQELIDRGELTQNTIEMLRRASSRQLERVYTISGGSVNQELIQHTLLTAEGLCQPNTVGPSSTSFVSTVSRSATSEPVGLQGDSAPTTNQALPLTAAKKSNAPTRYPGGGPVSTSSWGHSVSEHPQNGFGSASTERNFSGGCYAGANGLTGLSGSSVASTVGQKTAFGGSCGECEDIPPSPAASMTAAASTRNWNVAAGSHGWEVSVPVPAAPVAFHKQERNPSQPNLAPIGQYIQNDSYPGHGAAWLRPNQTTALTAKQETERKVSNPRPNLAKESLPQGQSASPVLLQVAPETDGDNSTHHFTASDFTSRNTYSLQSQHFWPQQHPNFSTETLLPHQIRNQSWGQWSVQPQPSFRIPIPKPGGQSATSQMFYFPPYSHPTPNPPHAAAHWTSRQYPGLGHQMSLHDSSITSGSSSLTPEGEDLQSQINSMQSMIDDLCSQISHGRPTTESGDSVAVAAAAVPNQEGRTVYHQPQQYLTPMRTTTIEQQFGGQATAESNNGNEQGRLKQEYAMSRAPWPVTRYAPIPMPMDGQQQSQSQRYHQNDQDHSQMFNNTSNSSANSHQTSSAPRNGLNWGSKMS